MSIFYVNFFLHSWAASVGVGISLTILESTGNNNGNTGGAAIVGVATGKVNGNNNSTSSVKNDKNIKDNKSVISTGGIKTGSGSNLHLAPSSGSVSMTGKKTGISSGNNTTSISGNNTTSISGNNTTSISGNNTTSISGNTSTSISGNTSTSILNKPSPKIEKEKIIQVEIKKQVEPENKTKLLSGVSSQNKQEVCEDSNKSSKTTVFSKLSGFTKLFLYGEKPNVEISETYISGIKENTSLILVSMSGTLKTKSGAVKTKSGAVKTFVESVLQSNFVQKDTNSKKTGMISKISGLVLEKTTNALSGVNNVMKNVPTNMIKSLISGNRVVERFVKSVFSYFK